MTDVGPQPPEGSPPPPGDGETRAGRRPLTASARKTGTDAMSYGLARALVDEVEEALEHDNLGKIGKLVAGLHSADLADLLELLPADDRATVVGVIRPQLRIDADVLAYLDEEIRDQVVAMLSPDEVAAALAELDSDDALALIEGLDDDERATVMARLPAAMRRVVEEGLTYPEYSAGRLMQREFVAVPMFWTVGKTIDYLRAAPDLPDEFYAIFIVDPFHRPVGAVPVPQVLRSKRSVRMEELISGEVQTVPVEMDQEEVAYLFSRYGMVSAPVVDGDGRLAGVITVDDVVDVIHEEAEDDLLKMGRVTESDLHATVLATSQRRLSWLIVTLINTIMASFVISRFEATIEQIVALAVLMPIVAAMGGNAGMQVVTVTVRALATRDLTPDNVSRIVRKELGIGVINGVVFASIMGTIAMLWFGDPMIGLVLAMAMTMNMIWAGLAGTVIPLTLRRFGVDPAVAAGPFLTTTTDVLGFFLFLGLATIILL